MSPLISWACCLLHTCPSLTPIHWCCTHKGAAFWHFTPKPRKAGSAEDLLLLKYQPCNTENGPCSWVLYKRRGGKTKGPAGQIYWTSEAVLRYISISYDRVAQRWNMSHNTPFAFLFYSGMEQGTSANERGSTPRHAMYNMVKYVTRYYHKPVKLCL